jgi:type IV secretory pathway VirB2 component (pilin)
MRESLLRRRGPKRFSDPNPQRSTGRAPSAGPRSRGRQQVSRFLAVLTAAFLLLPTVALAQSPWERAASNLEATFTGPLARSLALVAIVIGGLMFMFGEGGAKRQISGIVFGGGLALFAAQFLAWLF